MQNNSTPSDSDENKLRLQAFEALDFETIRKSVAGNTEFFAARALADDMVPKYSIKEVKKLQDETAEGSVFLSDTKHPEGRLVVSQDPTHLLVRSSLGGVLSGPEFKVITESLSALERTRSDFSNHRGMTPLLSQMAKKIPKLQNCLSRIEATVDANGHIYDSASISLGQIRRDVKNAYDRVTTTLMEMVISPTGHEALQDKVVTIRSDRMVLQVKNEFKHRVPGIVHDISNSEATLFVEPYETIEICNDWRELVLKEEKEIESILSDLSVMVGKASDAIMHGITIVGELDFILARSRFCLAASQARCVLKRGTDMGCASVEWPRVNLRNATHPLLGEDAVPINVLMEHDKPILVITGPNTGGKTVAMKTVGLLALMNQSGLLVPADSDSEMPVFKGVYADVGDHQSVRESISTFGSHLMNIAKILKQVDGGSLLLLDELCSSTDPEEGAALAKAIMNHLAEESITTVVTTHYGSVAAYAETSSLMSNARVDLDRNSFKPTYRLDLGIRGKSYAMSIASNLGLEDRIIQAARELLDPEYVDLEKRIEELETGQDQLRLKLTEAEKARIEANIAKNEVNMILDELTSKREELRQQVYNEVNYEFDKVRKHIQRAAASLSWNMPEQVVKQAAEEITGAKNLLRESITRSRFDTTTEKQKKINNGDTVEVLGLDLQGQVIGIYNDGDEIDVAIGGTTLKLTGDRLRPVVSRNNDETTTGKIKYDLAPALSSVELNIRGMSVEDGLLEVERFVDKAVRDGVDSVRIVHGRGTGILRKAVRELLSAHPQVLRHQSEKKEKGGEGATLVELV